MYGARRVVPAITLALALIAPATAVADLDDAGYLAFADRMQQRLDPVWDEDAGYYRAGPGGVEPMTNSLVLLTHSVIRWFRDHYLADDAAINDWRASPARAATLAGLPPAYVLTAGADPLRDEGIEYAVRLKQAGVSVTTRHFPGQFHGFFTMGKLLNQANIAASEIGVWLKALN